MATVFVSCMFHYDETRLEKWIQRQIPLQLFVFDHDYETVSVKTNNTNIICKKIPSLREVSWYNESITELPAIRNTEKDTLAHLWNMHTKVYVMFKNISDSHKYSIYMDFDCVELIQHDSSWEHLVKTYSYPHLYVDEEDRMYIPGCWGELSKDADVVDNVHWRFCGSFFMGSRNAIIRFYHSYEKYFKQFIEHCHGKLTWDVNFWAWLETHTNWDPVWYQGDHSDSMIFIPKTYGYRILKDSPNCKLVEYHYPNLSPYRPMSASYASHEGKEYLTTRYVNYWIYDNGCYFYPDDEQVIRTLNVLSPLVIVENIPTPLKYDLMKNVTSLEPLKNTFSEGIEDIRLYSSQETGKLSFIGSTLTYSYCDRIRMVRGDYDVDTKEMKNMQLIKPPYDTWCEKNWAPIPLADADGFVYRWSPLEIGKIVPDENNLGRLEICIRKPMDERFCGMKGSTGFVSYGESELIGVIHFSEEKWPRQYFHRVITLHKDTFELVQCSEIFCFKKACVEFCIGFRALENRFGFWISQMDRDPLYLEIEKNVLHFE